MLHPQVKYFDMFHSLSTIVFVWFESYKDSPKQRSPDGTWWSNTLNLSRGQCSLPPPQLKHPSPQTPVSINRKLARRTITTDDVIEMGATLYAYPLVLASASLKQPPLLFIGASSFIGARRRLGVGARVLDLDSVLSHAQSSWKTGECIVDDGDIQGGSTDEEWLGERVTHG